MTTAKFTLKNGNMVFENADEIWDNPQDVTQIEISNCDVTAAKITSQQAIENEIDFEMSTFRIDRSNVRLNSIFPKAAFKIFQDAYIRSHGQEMKSKFNGRDSITGEEFEVGTMIIWFRGDRECGKGTVIK